MVIQAKKMEVGAIILAGGKSSRMGKDKGLLPVNNKPMTEHLIDVLKKITNDIIIVSNNNEYQKFGITVVEDLVIDSGPLAGIYTGLTYSKYNKNIVLSCDSPLVSEKLLHFLIKNSKGFDVTIPVKNQKTHQLIGIYDKACLPIIKQEIENKQLKIKEALKKTKLHIVDANDFDELEFANINTPSDIALYYEN